MARIEAGVLLKGRPLPGEFVAARDAVATDFGVSEDWLNAGPADLVDVGLPDGFLDRVDTKVFGTALTVHFACRFDQIHFKLYALVDQGLGKHEQDLNALEPSREELLEAGRSTRTHDVAWVPWNARAALLPTLGSKMLISELRLEVRRRLGIFAWDQWAQMGVSSSGPLRADRWAQDPEALLLFTFQVARTDPRLFDEVLDWLALNERLVSSQRLRNLCRDELDRTLADSALAWAASVKANRGDPPISVSQDPPERVVFRGLPTDPERAEPSYAAHGWLKQPTTRSGKSQRPDLFVPINVAFRLRSILGIGARSEVARFLLTVGAPRVTAQVVSESAGYAKRNVHEALTLLSAGGVIDSVMVGNEQRYHIHREGWASLLGLSVSELPAERSWPQLLHALRRLLRWLEDEQLEDPTPYIQASQARRVATEILPELRYAGIRVPPSSGKGADYWEDFVELVHVALDALN